MRVRWHLMLTREAWTALSEDEREEWLAWDYYQHRGMDDWRAALTDKKLLYPESATALELRKYGL